MVFATHYLQLPWGWTGVNIFFVLSGFLITGILYDTRDQPHRIANFYIRRTLRIFPLYYGAMLLVVLINPIFHWEWNWHWLIWPAYLGNMLRAVPPRGAAFAMLRDAQPLSHTFPRVQLVFGHFWSLCVEEQFYLLWPWVVFGIKSRRNLIRICAAGILVMPILRILATHILPPATFDAAPFITVTPFPFDALLLGAIIALIRRGQRASALLPIAHIVFFSITAVFVGWLALHPWAHHLTIVYPYRMWSFTWGLSCIDLLSASLLVMALERGNATFSIFNLRPLRWVGRISYGAYVFHDILHKQFLRLVQHYGSHYPGHLRLPTAALAFACTLLFAWASYRWFESPILRLKDRWTRTTPEPAEQIAQSSAPDVLQHVA
jgi:peptidoglycan/LPS O-acetylase OafA/YrhL